MVGTRIPEATVDVADLPAAGRAVLKRFGISGVTPVERAVEVRVTAGRSVWMLRGDRFMRMPLFEAFRVQDWGYAARERDARWQTLEAASWCWTPLGRVRLWIVPARSDDSAGFCTGVVTDWCEL